jgi:integrase
MPATDLPYTYIAKRKYWRFRHPATGDVGLPKRDAPDFFTRYAELVALVERRQTPPPKSSWAWLIRRYRASEEFKALADATQIDYGKTLDLIVKELGDEPYALTTRNMIKRVRDDYAQTTRKAHKIKQMCSALYSWADGEDLVSAGFNPAKDVKRLKRKGGQKEYVCWSEWEFDLFASAAIQPMKTAAMLARYTGQRAEDLVRMVWTDFQGDMIRVRQSKTKAPLMIACHRVLRDYLNTLKAAGNRATVILVSAAGNPYNANSLSSAIGREVKRVADMPAARSIHGLRYMAGADLEEAGATVSEIESVLGHHTFKMALKYASQRLRAASANAKREAADGA